MKTAATAPSSALNGDALRIARREAREYKKALMELSRAVSVFLAAFDTQMQLPSSPKRGEEIARLCNALEFENDSVRHFQLGVDYRKDKKP